MAEGAAMHGKPPERYMIRESLSGWIWGLFLPLIAIGLAWFTSGLSLLLFLGYLVLMWRVYRYRRNYGDPPAHARLYALFCVLYKFPQVIGQINYWLTRWRGKPATLIEYKTPIIEGIEP